MATLWNYLLVTAIDKSGENLHEQLKKSVYLGWRSIFGALTIGLLLSLWLSVGYQATILNILGMNIVVFWIGYKLTIKAVQRTINPVQAGLENK
ncbi:hypothetical protein [Lacticaseibacillus camelliae]|nr:hypothetical protein [Lacticaseibacillus camelliae]